MRARGVTTIFSPVTTNLPNVTTMVPTNRSRVTTEVPTEALFILEWGGELTALGEAQSALLGARFRNTLYPGEMAGVLRLHSTYRHDLKIYSSDEGRVQMTAAAFTKGCASTTPREPTRRSTRPRSPRRARVRG